MDQKVKLKRPKGINFTSYGSWLVTKKVSKPNTWFLSISIVSLGILINSSNCWGCFSNNKRKCHNQGIREFVPLPAKITIHNHLHTWQRWSTNYFYALNLLFKCKSQQKLLVKAARQLKTQIKLLNLCQGQNRILKINFNLRVSFRNIVVYLFCCKRLGISMVVILILGREVCRRLCLLIFTLVFVLNIKPKQFSGP